MRTNGHNARGIVRVAAFAAAASHLPMTPCLFVNVVIWRFPPRLSPHDIGLKEPLIHSVHCAHGAFFRPAYVRIP